MNTLALIGGGFLLVVGLIVATAKLAAKAENERVRRWLVDQTNKAVAERTTNATRERNLTHGEWKRQGKARRDHRGSKRP